MGFYDRDYERDSYGGYGGGSYGQPGLHLRLPQSITMRLILINVIVYLVQIFTPGFTELFVAYARWWVDPWRVIGLLTSGFLHDVGSLYHLLFNMLALYFFGTAVEERLRKAEFTAFYMSALIFAAICWSLWEAFTSPIGGLGPSAVGASGAITGVCILFVFYNPHATILLFFVVPAKAWIAGVIWIAADLIGAMNPYETGHIAFAAHLGGALFGLLYHKLGWRLTDWLPRDFKLPRFKRRPPLKVHRGDDEFDDPLEAEVDRILQKIADKGQDSLTAAEKRTLQKGSAAYKKRRQ
jgi:membrane associated rhomboid family serine protease